MHIITGATSPAEVNTSIRRLLICSFPGEGKTYQTLTTCPNPVFCDFDNGISDPRLKSLGFQHLKFYDEKWCDSVYKKSQPCNAFGEFLKIDGIKLAPEQTLCVDSLSLLSDNMEELKWSMTPTPKGSTEKDGFAFWDMVKDYYIDLGKQFIKLKCGVVMTAHLEEVRKKESGAFMHYAPLVNGKFKQRIGQFFTDVVRIKTIQNVIGDKVTTTYKWQVKPDTDFPMAKSRSKVDTMYIDASWDALCKL